MKVSIDSSIQVIEAEFLFGKTVKIDLDSTKIGGSWQGKNLETGAPRPWDCATLEFFYNQTKQFKNPIIFDIGANTGTYSLLPVLNKNITVYAFEPNPYVYKILKNNILLNKLSDNVHTIPIALSNEKGNAILKIPASGTDSGLACIGNPVRFDSWHEIYVPMDTLDNIAKQKNISHVDLIKIDTEGCEFPILLGGEKLIRRKLPCILLEFDERNTAQFGYHPNKIIKLLTAWGYTFRMISQSDAYFYKKGVCLLYK